MITLKQLTTHLQELLLPDAFSDYCPNGLQVEGKSEVKKVAFAVSASLAAIEEAARNGVDALIVHHGIFWNKDSYPLVGPKKEKIALLLRHGISLLAYHLPLDAHRQLGNNWRAAQDWGCFDLEPFSSIGVKALFSSRPAEVLQTELETYYGHKAHVALGGKSEVRSLALISGGAHRSIEQAADEGVDCFITGSFDEMIWDIAHERQIHFFALGHYATERVGVRALMRELESQTSVDCHWLELPNPF